MPSDEGMKQEIRTVFWQDGAVVMIDQKALPLAERYVTCTDYREVIAAINDLTSAAPRRSASLRRWGSPWAPSIFPTLPPRPSGGPSTRSARSSRPRARRPGTSSGRSSGCAVSYATKPWPVSRDGMRNPGLPAEASSRLSERSASGPQSRAENLLSCYQGRDGAPPGDELPVVQGQATPWSNDPGGPDRRGDPDRRGGYRNQPPSRPKRPRIDPGRRPDSHPLQRRGARHRRLRDGPGRHPRGPGGGQDDSMFMWTKPAPSFRGRG